jgi:hypothetical protein
MMKIDERCVDSSDAVGMLGVWLILAHLAHAVAIAVTNHVHVRFGSQANICGAMSHVRFTPESDSESGPRKVMSALPQKRTCAVRLAMSALGH